MKLKTKLLILSALVAGTVSSNAASMIVSNVSNGAGDTLYATKDNVPMTGGLVTMGYFSASITESQIDTISELLAVLATPSNYTVVTSAIPGLVGSGIGDGYANQNLGTALGTITGANALLGRTIYSIVTNAASLGTATNANEFLLVNLGPIRDDNPDDNLYTSNPVAPATFVISSGDGTFVGDAGLGAGTYGTIKMAAVPEPSAALLGAIGALGLLRRRRN